MRKFISRFMLVMLAVMATAMPIAAESISGTHTYTATKGFDFFSNWTAPDDVVLVANGTSITIQNMWGQSSNITGTYDAANSRITFHFPQTFNGGSGSYGGYRFTSTQVYVCTYDNSSWIQSADIACTISADGKTLTFFPNNDYALEARGTNGGNQYWLYQFKNNVITLNESIFSLFSSVFPPTITPSGCEFPQGEAYKIYITNNTEGADIYYRIGTSGSFSLLPAEGYITISNSCTVYAYAVKDGEQSETVSESYTAITPVANSITSEELARYNIEIDNTTSGGFARTANVNISYYSADRSQIIIRNIFGYGNAITANVTWNSDGTATLSYNKAPIYADSQNYYYVPSPVNTVGNNYSGIGSLSGTLDADKITISTPWKLVCVDSNGYYDDVAIDATLTTKFVKSNATMKYDEVDVDNGGIMASYTIPVYVEQEDDEVYVYNFANLSARPRLILNTDGTTWYNENQTIVGSYALYPCDTQVLENDYTSYLTGNVTTRSLTWGEWSISDESQDACYYWQDDNGIYHNAIYTYGEINLDFDLDLPNASPILPPVVSPAGGEVAKNTTLSITHENGNGYTAYWTTSDIRNYTLEQLLADNNVTISDDPCVITGDITLYFLVLADDYSAMSNVVTYTYTIPEEPVTLAWLATNGVSGKTYTIADDLHIGGYRENTEDDLIRIIYAKDDNGYANESDLANYPGAVDYMAGPGLNMSVSDYDQSNWIGIYGWELTSVKNITKKIITGGTLRGVFTKDAGGNMSITIEDEPEVTTGSVAYVPNTYITCAFMGETQVAANGKTYFFVTPKPGELCHIKWAVYDGNGHFYVPASVDGANSNGLVGGFDIDWTYFRENGGSVGKFTAGTNYEFDAIVMKKASTGSGAPRRVEADNSVKSSDYTVYMLNSNRSEIPTGITGAKTDAKVVSVKYVNPMGIESDKPFEGINIVVTRYDNGTTSTSKVLK